jgi:hypothetical protein
MSLQNNGLAALIKVSLEVEKLISVIGKIVRTSNTVTTTNGSAYASGDNIGGILTISNALITSGGTAFINTIELWDVAAQSAAITIDFWDASPSGTYTNDAAQVIAGDQGKWLGSYSIASGDYVATGAVSRVTAKGLNIPIAGNASTNIFATLVTTGTPTYTSASGLVLKLGIIQNS